MGLLWVLFTDRFRNVKRALGKEICLREYETIKISRQIRNAVKKFITEIDLGDRNYEYNYSAGICCKDRL